MLQENDYTSYIKLIYFDKSKTIKFKNDLNKIENLIYIPEENILSDYGKCLRMNRSIQVEGAFAILKEDI